MRRLQIFVFLLIITICSAKKSNMVGGFLKKIDMISFFGPTIEFKDISQPCAQQMQALYENLYEGGNKNWALRMIDASSKLQSGLLTMNFGEIGNFEECIEIKAEDPKVGTVTGKYCLGRLDVGIDHLKDFEALFDEYITKNYHEQTLLHEKSAATQLELMGNNSFVHGASWAACFPQKCTSKDISSMVNYMIEYIFGTRILNMTFSEELCQTEEDVHQQLTPGAIITIILFSTYFVFLIGCTIYDVLCKLFALDGIQSFIAFSVINNGKRLFRFPNVAERSKKIECLDGLRFLSIMWVVFGHQYSIIGQGPITNTSSLIKWADSIHSMFIINGTISVDTFLVCGALLMTYIFLHYKKKNRGFSLWQYYLHRYIRLTPPLIAVVLISSTLLVYMGSGPRWPLVKPYFQDNCAKYWWSTILYIQNYVNINNMCVGQTWYLSVDWQLYLISPIILFGLWKWPKQTVLVLLSLILMSIFFAFRAAWINKLTAILSNPYGNTVDYSNKYYLLTHTRAAPWFIGVLFGFYIFQYETGEFRVGMKQIYIYISWFVTFSLMITLIFIGHGSLRDLPYRPIGNALHIALIRPTWAICMGWIIMSCSIDQHGLLTNIIRHFLSFSLFQVLNRLTYCIYLTHVTMMYLISFARKTPGYYSDFEMGFQFWGSFIFSVILAIIWSVSFESPFMALEKIWLRPTVSTTRDPSSPPSPASPLPSRISRHQRRSLELPQREDISLDDLGETSPTTATSHCTSSLSHSRSDPSNTSSPSNLLLEDSSKTTNTTSVSEPDIDIISVQVAPSSRNISEILVKTQPRHGEFVRLLSTRKSDKSTQKNYESIQHQTSIISVDDSEDEEISQPSTSTRISKIEKSPKKSASKLTQLSSTSPSKQRHQACYDTKFSPTQPLIRRRSPRLSVKESSTGLNASLDTQSKLGRSSKITASRSVGSSPMQTPLKNNSPRKLQSSLKSSLSSSSLKGKSEATVSTKSAESSGKSEMLKSLTQSGSSTAHLQNKMSDDDTTSSKFEDSVGLGFGHGLRRRIDNKNSEDSLSLNAEGAVGFDEGSRPLAESRNITMSMISGLSSISSEASSSSSNHYPIYEPHKNGGPVR